MALMALMALMEPVLLVPVAFGNTPLVTTTAQTWNSTVAGSLYSQMVKQALGALAAAGANSRIVGMCWVQGEADSNAGVTGMARTGGDGHVRQQLFVRHPNTVTVRMNGTQTA